MRFTTFGVRAAALSLAVAAMGLGAPNDAAARSRAASGAAGHAHAHGRGTLSGTGHARREYASPAQAEYTGRGRNLARFGYSGRIQCVPFARENTGIELSGNASQWWQNAEGVYERGARPEVGSVLNFRANGRMHMGHVAVVSNVTDSRNVLIDHANWSGPGASSGGISRDITVVDVSERNDWTAVRVALGHTGEFGSVYPTYGFIYDRPDRGTMIANNMPANRTVPAPVLNAAPRDLRPANERVLVATATQDVEEVAEATDDPAPRSRHVVRHGARYRMAGHAVIMRVHAAAPAANGGSLRVSHRRRDTALHG